MNETFCHSTTTVLTGSPVSREYEVRAFFGILSVSFLFSVLEFFGHPIQFLSGTSFKSTVISACSLDYSHLAWK